MKGARNRVYGALLLFLVGLGGAIAAAVRYPAGGLVLAAYVVGGLTAAFLLATMVVFAQAKAKEQFNAKIAPVAAVITGFLDQMKAASDAAADKKSTDDAAAEVRPLKSKSQP